MEWEFKTEMIHLGNQRDDSPEAKVKFQEYVLQKIDLFDNQAWEMFCNLTDIDFDQMKEDEAFWRQVYQRMKNIDCQKFGLRSGIRIALIQTFCEEELRLF